MCKVKHVQRKNMPLYSCNVMWELTDGLTNGLTDIMMHRNSDVVYKHFLIIIPHN